MQKTIRKITLSGKFSGRVVSGHASAWNTPKEINAELSLCARGEFSNKNTITVIPCTISKNVCFTKIVGHIRYEREIDFIGTFTGKITYKGNVDKDIVADMLLHLKGDPYNLGTCTDVLFSINPSIVVDFGFYDIVYLEKTVVVDAIVIDTDGSAFMIDEDAETVDDELGITLAPGKSRVYGSSCSNHCFKKFHRGEIVKHSECYKIENNGNVLIAFNHLQDAIIVYEKLSQQSGMDY